MEEVEEVEEGEGGACGLWTNSTTSKIKEGSHRIAQDFLTNNQNLLFVFFSFFVSLFVCLFVCLFMIIIIF